MVKVKYLKSERGAGVVGRRRVARRGLFCASWVLSLLALTQGVLLWVSRSLLGVGVAVSAKSSV